MYKKNGHNYWTGCKELTPSPLQSDNVGETVSLVLPLSVSVVLSPSLSPFLSLSLSLPPFCSFFLSLSLSLGVEVYTDYVYTCLLLCMLMIFSRITVNSVCWLYTQHYCTLVIVLCLRPPPRSAGVRVGAWAQARYWLGGKERHTMKQQCIAMYFHSNDSDV